MWAGLQGQGEGLVAILSLIARGCPLQMAAGSGLSDESDGGNSMQHATNGVWVFDTLTRIWLNPWRDSDSSSRCTNSTAQRSQSLDDGTSEKAVCMLASTGDGSEDEDVTVPCPRCTLHFAHVPLCAMLHFPCMHLLCPFVRKMRRG